MWERAKQMTCYEASNNLNWNLFNVYLYPSIFNNSKETKRKEKNVKKVKKSNGKNKHTKRKQNQQLHLTNRLKKSNRIQNIIQPVRTIQPVKSNKTISPKPIADQFKLKQNNTKRIKYADKS